MSNRFEDTNYVPYIIFESAQSRMERANKRWCIISVILIILIFATNGAWLYYNSQYDIVKETTTITQENKDGVNNFIGNDGDINNGETDNNEN